MMNHLYGWMGKWSGGGMWIPTVISVAIVILLAVVIGKMSKK
jgi:anti-sigma-K factor RskA